MSYNRFHELLDIHGTNVYKVSKATGIPASTFTDWKNGRSVPKVDKMMRIADFFGVSLGELLGDESARLHTDLRGGGINSGKRLPIIGEIRAGAPIITNEALLGTEYAEVDDADEYFFLRICGDSMKNIGILDGSLVLFRKQQYAENGDIVACLVGGDSATVKRFMRVKKCIRLLPENDDYKPIILSTDDFEAGEARILGVALEVRTKL